MRKWIVGLLVSLILALTLLHPAVAGGDKVRGDKAQGDAVQVQVSGIPWSNP